MSRTQFHSIELFILRHAWLNLWDKRMTTGRINQIAIHVFGASCSIVRYTTFHNPKPIGAGIQLFCREAKQLKPTSKGVFRQYQNMVSNQDKLLVAKGPNNDSA